MKRKITMVRPDGTKEIVEMDDGMGGGNAKPNAPNQNVAAMGQRGDTELAHVNPWEEMLLKMMGGAGTRNPQTGLKQFYTSGNVYDWYRNAFGREADQPGLDYWTNYGKGPNDSSPNVFDAFTKAGQAGGETYTGWRPDAAQDLAPYYPYTAPGSPPSPLDTGGGFDIPTNIMPTTDQSSRSGGVNTSYSGLPGSYQEMLLSALMPQLQSAITNMPGNIDQYTGQAFSGYQNEMNNALRENIPAAISKLANRGILSSTQGNEILSKVISNAANEAGNKGYQAAMQAALLKAGMPTQLAQIADLGKASTSTGVSSAESMSRSQDPTQIYQILAQMIMAQM